MSRNMAHSRCSMILSGKGGIGGHATPAACQTVNRKDRLTRQRRHTMTHDQFEMMTLTPKAWVESNRLWKRVDNVDHAKYQLGRPTSNKSFWRSLLELLGGVQQ